MGLKLVPDLPMFANDETKTPFDVIITDREGIHVGTYTEVMSFSFIVDRDYPNGGLFMLRSDGSRVDHACRAGDTIKNTGTGVTVEAVDV